MERGGRKEKRDTPAGGYGSARPSTWLGQNRRCRGLCPASGRAARSLLRVLGARGSFPEAVEVGGIRVTQQGVRCIPAASGPHAWKLRRPFPGRRLVRALLTWPAAAGGSWRTDRRIDGRTVSRSGGGGAGD